MFRAMRRHAQRLTDEGARQILTDGSCGVPAVAGDGGYPYAVPMSYAVRGGTIYFHCAVKGHKLDAIARKDKASFCVIGQDIPVAERFTTLYRSVIAFGRVRIVAGDGERLEALNALSEKYAPGIDPEGVIRADWPHVVVLALEIEHITAKQCRDLIGQGERQQMPE